MLLKETASRKLDDEVTESLPPLEVCHGLCHIPHGAFSVVCHLGSNFKHLYFYPLVLMVFPQLCQVHTILLHV